MKKKRKHVIWKHIEDDMQLFTQTVEHKGMIMGATKKHDQSEKGSSESNARNKSEGTVEDHMQQAQREGCGDIMASSLFLCL